MLTAALKNPVMLSWATEQIEKDREEKIKDISEIITALKPWLNIELYSFLEKKRKKEEEKVMKIAKVNSAKDVEVVNMFDVVMKNARINVNKIKEN